MSKDDSAERPSLDSLRTRIDALDQQIQGLLGERAELALSVARTKLAEANGEPVEFYRPEREAQILKRVAARNDGPMDDASLQRIFREIISASLALEESIKVAYLGPEGTFTHAALHRHFGHAVLATPEAGIPDIFAAVEGGRARFGVVPVENSIEGSVNQTLDQLTRTPLKVCGEVRLRIQHSLMSSGDSLDAIKTVYAHPQALAQCAHWLDANLQSAQRISASSNAAAAKDILNKPDAAAIAGSTAAELYGLSVLSAGIEDEKNNTTRFLIIGRQEVPPSGDDATLLLVAAPHRPGGLRHILEPFETAGVSMTSLESRPSRSGLWDYVFFIVVDGHERDANLSNVLAELREMAPLLKVLGSYPQAL